MEAEAYLRHYLAPFPPAVPGEVERARDAETKAVTPELAASYYYPPGPETANYLDVLSRAELLELLWQLLAVEYPQQRLTRRQVGLYGALMQNLKQEQAWRCAEMERLSVAQTHRQEQIALLEAEQRRLEIQVRATQAEAAQCQAACDESARRIIDLEAQHSELQASLTELRASTSWKLTAPLRRLGRSLQAWRAPEA
ncbi:MAG: hypothetical protein WAT67_08575 [Candidatus Contendobacter sp.]